MLKVIPRCYWLASYPKSGNTWIRMFLQAYGSGCVDLGNISSTLTDVNPNAWQAVSSVPITEMGWDAMLLIRNAVLVHLIAGARTFPIVIKTHNINAETNGIHPIPKLLTAGGVYIIRDPRDVAISFSNHLGITIDEVINLMASTQYILRKDNKAFQALGSWSHNVKSWKDFCVVKYEDLLIDPHKWFAEVLKGFKLTVNKPRLGKAIRLCDLDRMKKQEKKRPFNETSEHTDTFFHHGTSGHWQDILSADQARRIENDHREVMEQYGYLETNINEIRSCQI